MNDYAVPTPTTPLPTQEDVSRVGQVEPTPSAASPVADLHDMNLSSTKGTQMKRTLKIPLLAAAIVIAAGIGTGYGGARLSAKGGVSSMTGDNPQPMQKVAGDSVKAGDVFGVQDEKTFKDSAEGYLEAGGVDGEGSHKLLRAGGISQTVYLTSSVTDLSKFEGMSVKVWGETFKGQKAGWLMDVGRVQVVSPQAQAPSEE
jgi:hypothetical protein